MGFLTRVSSVAAPARVRAVAGDPFDDRYYVPAFWASSLSALGVEVTPELALTLSYVFCAVDTISADFGTMTCQTFEDRGHDERARVSYSAPGIGVLARKLRWQPNAWQTSKAFWSTLAWQYLLRPAAYAELIYRPGMDGFVEQLIPRHPDRVREERLPSGRVQFKLTEGAGQPRIVTQDEMFVVRNTSVTGLNALSRTEYGSKAFASALTLQLFTSEYFKKGASAALMATYKGDMDETEENNLHASITRFMSGAENAGGLLLVPEDIEVKALGVDPEKAQLLGLKNVSGRDVARMFKMPPSWLAIEGAQGYGTQVQDAENYKSRCQMPIAVEFEQAIQRDLILAVNRYFVKFNMDYLTRGDLLARYQAYEIGIRSRMIRPSEARVREDMSPDAALDKLSEGDFRPGTAAPGTSGTGAPSGPSQVERSNRATYRAMLLVHDNAVRCVRRERAAVEKLAKKHASDVEGWQAGLRDFYGDHAGFVAETMRLPLTTARAHAATHGSALEAHGIVVMTDAWAREEAEALGCLALDDAA